MSDRSRLAAAMLVGIAVVLAASACGGSKKKTAIVDSHGCVVTPAPSPSTHTEKKPSTRLDPAKTYDVLFQTNCGSFTVKLDVRDSPNTAASFANLVKKHFFDGTIFHRIVPGFVIQGGDPTQKGDGGPGYTTVDTPPLGAKYTHGVVAMAKTQVQAPGTSGSQFFVVTAPNAGLPADYALLGRVVKGLGVVDRIGKLGDASQQPTETVEIEHARLTTT